MNCSRLLLSLAAVLQVFSADPLPYAPAPNDTYWPEQWYLQNRDGNGASIGIDMDARGAWSRTTGQGVTVAIVDDGVDLSHPDLTNRARADLHWNFASETANGNPPSDVKIHGTPVAGLVAAQANNLRGMSGIAPDARFASWVVYKTNNLGGPFVDTNQLAKMFRFHLNDVQVQNHSWVKPSGNSLVEMSTVEDAAITEATRDGREGRGVVIVRAAGNDRLQGRNANDDAYISDARAVAVAALRPDGVVASYSNPGASILVSAPGGEIGFATLFSTDRVGNQGYNRIGFTNDLADYVFDSLGFTGTSAAAPLISGTAALVLSRNPSLSYRDVQQILLLSATQTNPADPDLQTNGAGLFVGHNSGYGLVNAATAVDLAGRWKNRPASTSVKAAVQQELEIPDGGLTLAIEPVNGDGPNLLMTALPSLGIHIVSSTANVPLVYVGEAAEPIQEDLTGKAALIKRGTVTFNEKLVNAANAGALFAVIFNNEGVDQPNILGSTDYARIPAISISQKNGENLTNIVASSGALAQIRFETAEYEFQIADALLCEQVKVTIDATHEQRGDMRITLVSPAGTRSILQRLGPDVSPFPGRWTFMSTHHFYESSQGLWKLQFGDEALGGTGSVHNASIEILGVPIKDEDRDGLDDDWELTHFKSLAPGATEDADQDGYSNLLEQLLGTDPSFNESPIALALSLWNESTVRLNWPSRPGVRYEVLAGPAVNNLAVVGEVPGQFPRSSWFARLDAKANFFTVREKP